MLLANNRFISELEVFNMSDRLKNKVAIVTGGSSGTSSSIVKRFIEEGAKVVIGDLQEPEDPELQQTLNQWQTQGLNFSRISVGYLCDINLFPILIDFISCQKLPLVIVDLVLGDNNQLYPQLNEAFISKMLQLCQWADVITPYRTELQLLIGKQVLVDNPSWSQVQNSILRLDQMLKHHTNIIVTGIHEIRQSQLFGNLIIYFTDKIALFDRDIFMAAVTS